MINAKSKWAVLSLVTGASLILGMKAEADSYVVKNGDSFYDIAQRFGMSADSLASNNGMGLFDLLVPGQVLQVPGASSQVVEAPAVSSVQSGAATHMVQAGESFSSIAASYGINYFDLVAYNGLSVYDTLVQGQILALPGVTSTVVENQVATASNDYYLDGFDYEAGINYPIGQCTWGVQKVSGWAGDWWGNAADWARNAQASGYQVGTSPMVGAIAVWDDGGYGHVAYVTAVESETSIQVLEANYAGRQWIDNHRGWFNPQDGQGQLSYIYPY